MKGSRDEYPLSAGILSWSPLTCSSTPPILRAASQSTLAYLNFEKYTHLVARSSRSTFATSVVILRTVGNRPGLATQKVAEPVCYRMQPGISLFSALTSAVAEGVAERVAERVAEIARKQKGVRYRPG